MSDKWVAGWMEGVNLDTSLRGREGGRPCRKCSLRICDLILPANVRVDDGERAMGQYRRGDVSEMYF